MSETRWFRVVIPEYGHGDYSKVSAEYLEGPGVVEVHGKGYGNHFFIWLSEADWDALVAGVADARKETKQ